MSQCEGTKLTPSIKTKVNVTVLDMMKRPLLRRTFFIATLDWVAFEVVYNGLNYNSGNLGVSEQYAFILGAAVEVLSCLLAWWAMDHWGRKNTVCWFMLMGGLACVSCGAVPDGDQFFTYIFFFVHIIHIYYLLHRSTLTN